MAWKFLNIGKANSEIERLSTEVATITKERDEARTALETNNAGLVKNAEELQGQATDARAVAEGLRGQMSALTAERDGLKAELQTAQEKLANPSEQVVKIAAARALEITGAQGQPPLPTTPANTPAGGPADSGEALMSQLNAIKDPNLRTQFYRKNAAAFRKASLAERAGK
jgi:seryl-tRNA synthetase